MPFSAAALSSPTTGMKKMDSKIQPGLKCSQANVINNKGAREFRRLGHEILEFKLNGERTKYRRGLAVKRYEISILMRVVELTSEQTRR